MIATYPTSLRTSLSSIAQWDHHALTSRISDSNNSAYFYSVLATVTRVAMAALGLTLLTSLGMLNPFYIPITLSLFILAYHPLMSVTYHLLCDFAAAAKEEADRYTLILEELEKDEGVVIPFEIPDHALLGNENTLFKKVIQAQYRALESKKTLKNPQELETLKKEYKDNPSEGSLRAVYEAEFKWCIDNQTNMHVRVHQAFLCHIAHNPFDKRALLDFGKFHEYQVNHILVSKEDPIAVFCLNSDRSISDAYIQHASINELALNLFREE